MTSAAAPPSFSHPRRRAASPSLNPDSLIDSLVNMSIRKGATFHTPTINDSDLLDPFESKTTTSAPIAPAVLRSMTARSTTCPKELEDLLVGAGERRVVEFLAKVDEAVNNKSVEQLGSVLSEPDVLPVPDFLVEGASVNSHPDHTEDQAYDSGLGSSISSEGTIKIEDEDNNKANKKSRKLSCSGSAITRSISGASDSPPKDTLSHFAIQQIHRFIVRPILTEPALKDFHLLIAQVPRRIGDRQINNLRDLEKTLIFLAPDYSRSPAAYLQFCETSIHCLHATVNGVHESDQRLPTDRPYTNHYFLDLVQQIRRYAQILAANRARQAKGEQVDDMDVTPTPLEIRGGMTQTGRPAQLGYRTEDQLISLADDQPLQEDAVAPIKRRMSEDIDDDGVPRSMARRKKGELPKTYTCPVGGCDKEFNRPCDRTKHLKTHERPHKCPEAGCDFKTRGFPTEKERDRHWSDRHDPDARTWDCQFKDSENCPYSSKREHNLKSHMEKAHGWTYVRSKGVKTKSSAPAPKTKAKAKPRQSTSTNSSSSTPFTYNETSPSLNANTDSLTSPGTVDPSPVQSLQDFEFDFNPDFAGHFNTDIFSDNSLMVPQVFPYTPSLSDGRRASHVTSSYSTPTMPMSSNMGGDMTMMHDMTGMGNYQMNPPTPDDMAFGMPDANGVMSRGDVAIPPTPEDLEFSHSVFNKWNFQQSPAVVPGEVDLNKWGLQQSPAIAPGDVDLHNGRDSGYLNNSNFGQSFQEQLHPAVRDDPMFTSMQNYNLQATGGTNNTAFEGQDFQLDDYISNTGVNEPLFTDATGFGEAGSQFDVNSSIDSNPFRKFFPEIN
ncbi:hypothetical protein AAFC00_007299 [Neodothiora populina]|uniref:C2H2-type domain-containing protein n=1 Tax=Neodothiora populina TaxID=2781224 RepID=A0ABR3PHU8_9PEZI